MDDLAIRINWLREGLRQLQQGRQKTFQLLARIYLLGNSFSQDARRAFDPRDSTRYH